jgi:tetratricopeptide (TPR) repeat protein
MKDFFISYNRADRAWAEWIARELQAAGLSVVSQFADFGPGSNFVVEIDRATQEANRLLAVLSPAYLAATFPVPEWTAFFAKDPTGEGRLIIPVRVRDCAAQGLLGQVVYIDLVDLDENAARSALLKGVGRPRSSTVSAQFPGRVFARFPGALPRIWNVPHLRNPFFTGRDALLDRLAETFQSGRSAAMTQAIAGLGGVGKTQLAVEYLYRHASEYEVAWWVRAETPATLGAHYAGLAGPLGLPEADLADQSAVVAAVRHWCEGHGGWVLVFDNATEPQAVRDYLPRSATGHVLLTSRRRDWTGTAGALEVETFERREAVQFLRNRIPEIDETIAETLAEKLGDLPLALTQAAAYIEDSGLSPASYLELFRKRRQELLRRGLPADYPEAVATTWEISFRQLEAVSPEAAALLQLCAFFAPDDIPLDLFPEGAEFFPKPLSGVAADPLALHDAISAARRLSLLEADGKALCLHRLVQAAVRDRCDEEGRKLWAAAAVRCLWEAYPFEQNRIETWQRSGRLLPHALAVAEHAETLKVEIQATAWLLNQAASYFWKRAELGQALPNYKRALAVSEFAYGPRHPEVATAANNIGTILKEQGDLGGALQYTRRALEIDEATYGPQHPEVATDANNIGMILKEQGDLEGALQYTRRALEIDEATYGPHHPNVARDANNIGTILREQGNLQGALQHIRRALEIAEAAYVPQHPYIAGCANNIGQILMDQGDLEGALQYTRRALESDEAVYGPQHPEVARDANNIGLILLDQGELAEAKKFFLRAVGIFQKTYGEDHPSAKTVAANLAALEQQILG